MNILVTGDSIVAGEGDSTGLGWVGLLRLALAPKGHLVYELGIHGDTSWHVLQRLPQEMQHRNPDLVILAVGVNDASVNLLNHRIDRYQFLANIEEMVLKMIDSGKVLVVGLTPVDDSRTNPVDWYPHLCYRSADVKKYDEALQALCLRLHVPYVLVRDVLSMSDLSDGVHPNSHGYELLFQQIFPYLPPGFSSVEVDT